MEIKSNLNQFSNVSRNYNSIYNLMSNIMQISGDKVIEMFKKGHKIHIKKKNRGSFTRWCGGNVTEECIRRGKNSPNPAIRKKATFAQNVRKFKH